MTHNISSYPSAQVIQIHQLLNEMDSNLIFKDIQNSMAKGIDKIIIDLSKLDFMNSVGINFLLRLLRHCGEKLTIANPSKQVLKLLKITQLHKHFDLYSSVEDALQKEDK